MRKKILYTFFIFLLIANTFLLYMLIEKPHKKGGEKDNFLTSELQFDKIQEEKFQFFDQEHRMRMQEIEKEIRLLKEVLFNSFSDTTFTSSTTTEKIGTLEAKKEQEVYAFFKQVRKLCDKEQAKKFDQIIKKALHKRGPKGRGPEGRRERRPPPR
ncbi:MAG: hypothetical protein JXQ93_12890 [Flavobacteriaceae bacterium]